MEFYDKIYHKVSRKVFEEQLLGTGKTMVRKEEAKVSEKAEVRLSRNAAKFETKKVKSPSRRGTKAANVKPTGKSSAPPGDTEKEEHIVKQLIKQIIEDSQAINATRKFKNEPMIQNIERVNNNR